MELLWLWESHALELEVKEWFTTYFEIVFSQKKFRKIFDFEIKFGRKVYHATYISLVSDNKLSEMPAHKLPAFANFDISAGQ